MKVPRDLGGEELARLLGQFGYVVTRQAGRQSSSADIDR